MVFKESSQSVVNYEDPNINVSIPVFSVHGNHDDPTGVCLHLYICPLSGETKYEEEICLQARIQFALWIS